MNFNYFPYWSKNSCVCNCSVICFNYIETQNVMFSIWRWGKGVIFELSYLLGWDWGCCLSYCRQNEQYSEEPQRSSLMFLKTQMPLIRYEAMSGRQQCRCWETGRKGKLRGVRFFFQLLLQSRIQVWDYSFERGWRQIFCGSLSNQGGFLCPALCTKHRMIGSIQSVINSVVEQLLFWRLWNDFQTWF